MHYITPTLSITLEWLEEQAPIGEWIIPEGKFEKKVTKRVNSLVKRGFVEIRDAGPCKPRHVRVLVPRNSPGVTQLDTYYRSPESIEKLREAGLAKHASRPNRKLIPYAGFDGSSAAW